MNSTLHAPSRTTRPARRGRPASALCAWLLVLLVALPFTPPFSTCDAGMLFADAHSPAAHLVQPVFTSPSIAMNDGADAFPGSLLEEEPFQDALHAEAITLSPLVVTPAIAQAIAAPLSVSPRPIVALRL